MTFIGASGSWGFHIENGSDDADSKSRPKQPGWVRYSPGLLPSVGDVFILYEDDRAGHCGVVCQVTLDPRKFWITGDGGQPDRTGPLHKRSRGDWARSYNPRDPDMPKGLVSHEAAYLVPRVLDCADPMDPLIANFFTGGGGETLGGWRNVMDPGIFMHPLTDAATGSEEDYKDLKKRIKMLNDAALLERAGRYPDDTL